MPSDLDPDDNLGDSLSAMLDEVRRSVHGSLHTRSYRVQVVSRRWSGPRIGEGTAQEEVLELDPRPLVVFLSKDQMAAAGREAVGGATLTEVSLKYSSADLQPVQQGPAVEVAYRVIDDSGQQQRPRYFVLDADPMPRRGDRRGDGHDWRITLKETSAMGDLDGANL